MTAYTVQRVCRTCSRVLAVEAEAGRHPPEDVECPRCELDRELVEALNRVATALARHTP